MKKIVCLLFISLLAASPLFAQTQKTDFRWLTGVWKIKTGSGFIVESWQQVNDSLYKGNRDFKKGQQLVLYINCYRAKQ
jgi:hypothetical protein